ncbi:MAG: phosphatase PAP2 family protein [Burkholderiaceae bacterium]
MRQQHRQSYLLAWHKWAERDRSWSLQIHRASGWPLLVRVLVTVSWLSNGKLWYSIIALMPWLGSAAGTAGALRMTLLGVVNLLIYTVLKRHFARPRPYINCPGVSACTRALDEFSFPSGHVLHAVGFSTILVAYFPVLGWIAWPFTVLVALSRVALGLHYPSDVVVGALLGWLMGHAILMLF